MPAEQPPRWTRSFVAVFLGAFAVCGVLGIEAWPLTGWHLFSQLRSDHQVSWSAISLDANGNEREIRFERLPRAYRNFRLVMRDFSRLGADDRAAGGLVRLVPPRLSNRPTTLANDALHV